MKYISITHGDKHESVANEEIFQNKIGEVIQNGETIFDNTYNINDRKGNPVEGRLVVVSSNEKPINYLGFMVKDDPNKNFTFNSLYPYVIEGEGTKIEVEIIDILEEKSYTFEGIIECNFDGKHLYFFDPFYYKNKDKYIIGKKCTIEISGLIYHAGGLTEEESKINVDWTIEQRKATGVKLEYDENGNLKPVVFDITQMNSFIPYKEYPGDFEFQCRMKDLGTVEFNGETLYKIGLEIVKENGVKIPFVAYTRETNITNKERFGDGLALRGVICLQGILCK